jgi:glycosyltransferase involved in cell wall biosynthesis
MKLAVVGHCSIEDRQRWLFETRTFEKDEISIIFPEKWNKTKIIFPKPKKGLRLHSLKVFFEGKITKYFLLNLKKKIKEINPEIIYCQAEPWSLIALQCSLICSKLKIPLVLYSFENLERVYYRRDKKYLKILKLIERIIYKKSRVILAGNKDSEKILRKRGFKGKIMIIPISGINTKIFNRKRKNFQTENILYVGRIVVEKGIEDIILALVSLKKDKLKFKMVFVGEGEDMKYFNKMVEKNNLSKEVTFLGGKNYLEVSKYMKDSNVFLYPSRKMPFWEEQFGFSIPEALSSGCEVITSDTGAIREWFADWVWLVPEKDPESIAKSLKKILLKKRRNFYKGEYSLTNIAKKTRKILEDEIKR